MILLYIIILYIIVERTCRLYTLFTELSVEILGSRTGPPYRFLEGSGKVLINKYVICIYGMYIYQYVGRYVSVGKYGMWHSPCQIFTVRAA